MANTAPTANEKSGGDLGAPIGLSLLAISLAIAGVVVGGGSSWRTPLLLAAIVLAALGCAGLFFELAKTNGRESYRDFGTVVALLGIATFMLVFTEVYTFSETTTNVLRIIALVVGGFGILGVGIGISRVLNENKTTAAGTARDDIDRTLGTSPPPRMSRYERLSLVSVVAMGLLAAVATIAAAYIQKG